MASLGERRGGENKKEGPGKMGLGLGDLGVPLEKVWWPPVLLIFILVIIKYSATPRPR